MPEIILLEIYAHLSVSDRFSASSTCKQWRAILFHPNNWPHTYINFKKADIQREIFLSNRVGHFLGECTIKLGGDFDLLLPLKQYQSVNSLETVRLLQKLSTNKRLKHLTFHHSPTSAHRQNLRFSNNNQVVNEYVHRILQYYNVNNRIVTRSSARRMQNHEALNFYGSTDCSESATAR